MALEGAGCGHTAEGFLRVLSSSSGSAGKGVAAVPDLGGISPQGLQWVISIISWKMFSPTSLEERSCS